MSILGSVLGYKIVLQIVLPRELITLVILSVLMDSLFLKEKKNNYSY